MPDEPTPKTVVARAYHVSVQGTVYEFTAEEAKALYEQLKAALGQSDTPTS